MNYSNPEAQPERTPKPTLIRVPWADFVSNILAPPVVWTVLAPLIALQTTSSTSQAVQLAAVYVIFVCIIPSLYIFWQFRRGVISDIHLPRSSDRLRPFIVTAAGAAITLAIYLLGHIEGKMLVFALATLVQISILGIFTAVWKISIHATCIGSAAMAVGLWFGLLSGLMMIPLVLLVVAARLRLLRHTIFEVISGLLVGSFTVIILTSLVKN